MTQFEEPVKTEPTVIADKILYLSDLEVELTDSDDDSNYTDLCFCDDLEFDPYYDADEDSDDDDIKIHPSEK
jgi:hypothetical protein